MTHCPFLCSFKTMETCEDGDDLVFFYQVCEGVANASHASHTAAQAGLPDRLIARGKEVRSTQLPAPAGLLSTPLASLGAMVSGPMKISDPYFLFFYSTPPPPPFLLGPRSQT